MTPLDGRTVVEAWMEAYGPGSWWPQHCAGTAYANAALMARIDAAITAARAEARDAVLHEVNRVFCGGAASALSLEFMRDMHDRVVRAEARAEATTAERERCARCLCFGCQRRLPTVIDSDALQHRRDDGMVTRCTAVAILADTPPTEPTR